MDFVNSISNKVEFTCRTCLTHSETVLKSIFECKVLKTKERLSMMEKILEICSIQICEKDEMKAICETCQEKLETTLSFLEQCVQVDIVLKHNLQVKNETSVIHLDNESVIYAEEDNFSDDNDNESMVIKADPDLLMLEVNDPDEIPLSLLSSFVKNEIKENSKTYKCRECEKTFKSSKLFLKHKLKHKKIKIPYPCSICNEVLKSFQELKRHMIDVHNKFQFRPYTCTLCKKSFQTRFNLNRHSHAKHICKSYLCEHCKKSFSTLSSLKYHENIHFGLKPYTCSLCPKSFSKSYVLKQHIKQMHCETMEFTCHCGKGFIHKKKLEIHIDSVHEKTHLLRKYACELCDKKYQHPYSLKEHMNIHLGLRPYMCSVCAAAFYYQNNLRKHFRKHNSEESRNLERKHLCSECGNSYSRAEYLKRHMLRKHSNAEKKFECPICKKRFLEKSDVKCHIKLHDKNNSFMCSQCSKCFKTNYRLQTHINRVHIGLRPYECTTCNAKFQTKYNLEEHARTHTGEKPYSCPHCSYACGRKSCLNKHVKNIHLKSR